MANTETEHVGIEYVLELERRAGRQPEDVHLKGVPYDVYSPPRKIEVKAFGGSAEAPPSRWKTGKSRKRDKTPRTTTSTSSTTSPARIKSPSGCYTANCLPRCLTGRHPVSPTGQRSGSPTTTTCHSSSSAQGWANL